MITTEKLAAMLTDKLNEYPLTLNGREYSFFIHSNEGEYIAEIDGSQKRLPTNVLNGVLIEQSSTPVPLAGLNSILLMQSLTVVIPVNMAARRLIGKRSGGIDYAMKSLNAFVQRCAGLTGTISDEDGKSFSYALSVSTPMVGSEDYYGEIGKAVPVTMQVSWQFIENGVLANDVTITLDGTPVVLMDGAIVRTRTGDVSNVDGSEEMQTAITQQGLTFRIVMPLKRGDVSSVLKRDMLTGNLGKTYTLVYDDRPVANGTVTNNGDVISVTVCTQEITQTMTAGKGITLSVTLTIARRTN